MMVAMVVVVGLGRNGRDGEDSDSGEGKNQIANFHQLFLSSPESL